jgi:hypothetical protein
MDAIQTWRALCTCAANTYLREAREGPDHPFLALAAVCTHLDHDD